MLSLYDAYEKIDASLIEINPFLLTKDSRLIALDAKVTFDDNAMFRHKNFIELRDLAEEEPPLNKESGWSHQRGELLAPENEGVSRENRPE